VTIVKQFLAQRKVAVLDHPFYSPDLAPADYFLFPKVKSHLKGRLFDSISDIQKAVTSTLNINEYNINIKHHCKGRLLQRHPEAV
jgi:transposase